MKKLVLYYRDGCPYCHKVLDYLEQENISVPPLKNTYETVNRQELIKIGGKPQVPCLVIDGKALYESDDIIQWFAENGSV